MKRFLVRYPFMVPVIGIVLGAIIAFVLSMAPGFVKSAYACGGWWDPCCPWWEPERCAAFNANKKQVAEENEAYFQRWEERLENLNRVIGLLPVGSFPGWVVSQAKDAVTKAKEANAAVARREGGQPVTEYAVAPYEWVNQLGEDAAALGVYGFYSGGQAAQYTSCMQAGGESGCQGYKDNAQWGIREFGLAHSQMANTLDMLAWQLEYWYGGSISEIAEAAAILREMANRCRYTAEVYQQ